MALSMADLLAKQDKQTLRLNRNQEVQGTIVAILDSEIILDLGTKAEGALPKRDLSPEQVANLKVGDRLEVFVISPENESGQVVLSLQRSVLGRNPQMAAKWRKFEEAGRNNQTLKGKALEVNKGGLVVEINSLRGFLPSSQVSLEQASNLDKLIGQELSVSVIEVDPSQNRLILTQKHQVSEETKKKLSQLKLGDKIKGKVAEVLPFGLFIKELGDDLNEVEGLVHISEVAWERSDNVLENFAPGQEIEAAIVNVEPENGRINLSIRQLSEDPFEEIAKKYMPDDVVKGEVTKVNSSGVSVVLPDGLEGIIPAGKLDGTQEYKEGEEVTVLIDTIDTSRRRILLSPFLTSTEGLIYK